MGVSFSEKVTTQLSDGHKNRKNRNRHLLTVFLEIINDLIDRFIHTKPYGDVSPTMSLNMNKTAVLCEAKFKNNT